MIHCSGAPHSAQNRAAHRAHPLLGGRLSAAGAEFRSLRQGRAAGRAERGRLLRRFRGLQREVVDVQGLAQEGIALDEIEYFLGQALLADGSDGRRQQQG